MIKALNELPSNLELINSTNRAILKAFSDNEIARMDELIYIPIEETYNSLGEFLSEFKNGYDLIAKHEENKSMIKNRFGTGSELVKLIDPTNGNRSNKVSKKMIDQINPILEFYAKFTPIQEAFYLAVARAAKDVGQSCGVKPVELFNHVYYSDEIQREIIPTRKGAEIFLKTSQLYEKSVFDLKRHYLGFARKNGKLDKQLYREARFIPSLTAEYTLQSAIRGYKSEEFDRIYIK